MGETLNNNSGRNPNADEWDQIAIDENNRRKQEYLNSEAGKKELEIEEKFDSTMEGIDSMVARGQMTEDQARRAKEKFLDRAIDNIDNVRQEEYNQQQGFQPVENPIVVQGEHPIVSLQGEQPLVPVQPGENPIMNVRPVEHPIVSLQGEQPLAPANPNNSFDTFNTRQLPGDQQGLVADPNQDQPRPEFDEDGNPIIDVEYTVIPNDEDDEKAKAEAEAKAKAEAEAKAKAEEEAKAKGEEEDKAKGEEEEKDKNEEEDKNKSEDDKEKDTDPEAKEVENEARKNKEARLKEINESLEKMLPNLAELYARNRRLFVGAKNRANFAKAKQEYQNLLGEAMRLRSELTYEAGKDKLNEDLEKRFNEMRDEIEDKLVDFAKGEDGKSPRSSEEIAEERNRLSQEAEDQLKKEYGEMNDALKAEVSAAMVEELLNHQNALEDATIDKLDNGTFCRKFVHKVINNKYLKGALIAAGVAGLAVTGVGLATGLAAGTMAVGVGYSAAGVAMGAGRGALMGGLMSRQDSKNSAVRGFANEEAIRAQLEGLQNSDDNGAKELANWLMDQYSEANTTDASSNRKRTAVSAGLGAAIGGVMSGIHIDNVSTREVTDRVRVGTEPTKIEPDLFDNVNIPEGHGAYDTFTQMGGDPNKLQQALDIMHNIDSKYGLVPGSNGAVPGYNGQIGDFAHTYPGTIDTWPDVAQSYIREVAEEWARQGLIPSHVTGGGPIYDTITRTVTDYVPNAFMNLLTQATATVGAGAIGGAIGGARRNNEVPRTRTPETPPRTPNSPETPPTQNGPETPSTPEAPTPTGETGGETIDISDLERKRAELEEELRARGLNTENIGNTVEADDIARKRAELEEELRARGLNPEDQPAEPEGQPEDQSGDQPEEEPTPANLGEAIRQDFIDAVGEEGVDIMTSEEPINEENSARIAEWWNTLDNEQRQRISTFERALGTSAYGRALRAWLQTNGQISL